jgi:hypothetical protein
MKKYHILFVAVAFVLTSIERVYYLWLKVPAVMEIRPELRTADLLTGVFSGRGMVYIWYHYPAGMTVLSFILALTMTSIFGTAMLHGDIE